MGRFGGRFGKKEVRLPLPEYGEMPLGSFWRPTKEFIDELSSFLEGKRVLEVFAGNGLLSGLLSERGVECRATSILSSMDGHEYGTYCEVEDLDAVSSVAKYGNESDVLLMCWPTTVPDVLLASLLMGEGKDIVFIGEVTDYSRGLLGGCATDEFFDAMEKRMEFGNFEPRNMLERAVVFRSK